MTEWIPSLSTRKKWLHERKNLQENDVELLVFPDSFRALWPLVPGKDGRVRSVKLEVGDRELVRPIVKLCPLELDCSA